MGRHTANLIRRSGYSQPSFWPLFQTALSSIGNCFIKEPVYDTQFVRSSDLKNEKATLATWYPLLSQENGSNGDQTIR
jgi:hypothetical protein